MKNVDRLSNFVSNLTTISPRGNRSKKGALSKLTQEVLHRIPISFCFSSGDLLICVWANWFFVGLESISSLFSPQWPLTITVYYYNIHQ